MPATAVMASRTNGNSKSRSLDMIADQLEDKKSSNKRRCIGSACIACKRRKSKCDGALPSCAACTAVYDTPCEYDLTSDHRRRGVYKKASASKPKPDTLQTLIEAILNYPEDEAFGLVKRLRNCENLEDVAKEVQDNSERDRDGAEQMDDMEETISASTRIEQELANQIGHMRLEDGIIHFLGGTSNLRFSEDIDNLLNRDSEDELQYTQNEDIVRSWTSVTTDVDLILHLLQLYFTWHYPSFVTLSKSLFFRDFFRGKPTSDGNYTEYCTPLLVNAMLALGCHFTAWPRARSNPDNHSTAGDHFFQEAKRLIVQNEEYEKPRLATVQALALMSVREAGCAREAKGWIYSGMSFRMACDLGLNIKSTIDRHDPNLSDEDVDAQQITFWGCYQFDKCWSNYLGRPPQLTRPNITVAKFDVFPDEDAALWSPRTDTGIDKGSAQPARTRAAALQMSSLCEISEDLLLTFYSPTQPDKQLSKVVEVKRLSEFHTRLEAWLKALPKEMEAREGQLPYILVMHMFFHLLYIHLFRPFLRYMQAQSPIPAEVSPRKRCTDAAVKISKLLRLYKRTHGLEQICNIVVYIIHSACSIHLLNLPGKEAKRDLTYGVRHLEEIAKSWPCATRTLATLALQVRRWKIELPSDLGISLIHWETKYKADQSSPSLPKTALSPIYSESLVKSVVERALVAQTEPPTDRLDMSNTSQEVKHGLLEYSMPLETPSPNHKLSRASRPAFQPSMRTRVPGTLYGEIDSLFEENKDWCYKDQSAFFENWSQEQALSGLQQSTPEIQVAPGNSNDQTKHGPNLHVLEEWDFANDTMDYLL